MGGKLQKHEAISLLKEIQVSCHDSLTVSFVSLQKPNPEDNSKAEGYELRIKCQLGKTSRKNLCAIVEGHNLRLEESNGLVVIYTPKREEALSLVNPLS